MNTPGSLLSGAFPPARALAQARQRASAHDGSVWDALCALPEGSKLAEDLCEATGVVPPPQDEVQWQPQWQALPLTQAQRWHCVVLQALSPATAQTATSASWWLGAADPWDDVLLAKVARLMGRHLAPIALRQTDLQRWLGTGTASAESAAPAKAPATQGSAAQAAPLPPASTVVNFVDTAIRTAWQQGASDIHFECDRQGVSVKLRLDGVMTPLHRLEGVQPAQEVISRIKVLAQLDITERRLPQDGRFRFETSADRRMDLRVSIMPSVFGEDAVLRLLDKSQLRTHDSAITLESLGFEPQSVEDIRSLAAEPSGMLLVTGPTGSGKTTTVYAALSEINTGREKIITIEDPVEYELPGVLQIPVNERKGLTFAKGLRSILRHDPDRILVGEIRDAETAEIAVQSALTGHLVFTTVHANGVADIMGRFRHFGLDMFGFMSSLNGVVVQRLMRRICSHCMQWRSATPREQAWLAQELRTDLNNLPLSTSQVPQAVGCEVCRDTGYKGRFVVAEVHLIDDKFRDHVTEGAPVSVLKQHAYAVRLHHGHERSAIEPLVSQALRRVLEGQTSLEEVKRVVGGL